MQIWTPNQQIQNGRFIIQKVIGSGGYGITYSALEQPTGKIFVLKTLNYQQQTRPDFPEQQQKFVQEAFRLAKCHHPHIVEVHDVFQEKELWVMVMEYIDGENLAEYVHERGKLSEDEALHYIEQVGKALEYVHDRGFLHRDVKPNNILLRRTTKEAVLIDFGLAREFTAGRTGSMTNTKTEGYAPIEQYERYGKFGNYTDVYALAATLYSLLTGKVPFPAIFRNQGIPLPPPKQFNSQISDRVNDAILKGMALEPEKRTQTVLQFRKDLGLVSSGFPPTIVKPTLPLKSFSFEVVTVDARGNITNRRNREAKYFAEDLGKGVTLEMVQIPGGTFIMGSPESEKDRDSDESPQHQVTVPGFFMGKYPVTQAQYQAIMGTNPSYFKGEKRPVERVSWDDAVEFCKKLSQITGKNYRLPSEAEWEYACRAGTTTPFYFGETITPDLVNYDGNFPYGAAPKGKYREQTTDVGNFPPNSCGLYDMCGNVWEWCQDVYNHSYQATPIDGSAWLIGIINNIRLLLGDIRLLRGGS